MARYTIHLDRNRPGVFLLSLGEYRQIPRGGSAPLEGDEEVEAARAKAPTARIRPCLSERAAPPTVKENLPMIRTIPEELPPKLKPATRPKAKKTSKRKATTRPKEAPHGETDSPTTDQG